jgi:hypothetical protein
MTPQELQIRNLRQDQLKAQRKGDHLQALKLNMQIIDLQKQATEVKVDLIDLFKQLPKELVVKMLTNMNGIALMIDWIDLLTMEINDAIKIVDKDSTVHHFDSIIQLGKEAKKHMSFMHQKTGESYQNAIAENSDELLEKTLKGVKKIMTKMK